MNFSKFQIPDSRFQSGFALIELLVTTSIIAIISSIVLFSFPSFASTIILENLTHEIALVVRQAQVYGTSIRAVAGTDTFPGYGAHFDASEPTKVIFFADIYPPSEPVAGNGVYTNDGDDIQEDGEDIPVEIFTVERGNTISELCYTQSGIEECDGVNTLDITFKRPDPDANIRENSGIPIRDTARIKVSPPAGSTVEPRFITVYLTGQITVTSASE